MKIISMKFQEYKAKKELFHLTFTQKKASLKLLILSPKKHLKIHKSRIKIIMINNHNNILLNSLTLI
jgi:hypothetical protein